ncbi:MAG: response regulator [Candidatus Omnitrophica bacterium]|nr:response regulator [Candidatus Omnitrophota bacterium]MCK4422668.1 response regulator [Candidatus Omnitrophota bacterium]
MKKILIISTDEELIQGITFFLNDYFQIRTSADIKKIRGSQNIFNSDAVFLDIDIDVNDHIDGLMLLKEIKSYHPSLPVIAFSCCLAQKVIKCALRLGAADYLIKPLDLKLFQSCLEDVFP